MWDAGSDPSLPGSFFSGSNPFVGLGATIIAHQNVQNRMSAPTGASAANAAVAPIGENGTERASANNTDDMVHRRGGRVSQRCGAIQRMR